jgi:hypothetical protein
MDLQRLQVVITAKTQELQKQLSNITKKLNSVEANTTKVENNFKQVGKVGANSFKEIVKAAEDYNRALNKFAVYQSKYDMFGPGPEPFKATVAELKKQLKSWEGELKTAKKGMDEWLDGEGPKVWADNLTLGLGMTVQSLGNAKDALEAYKAVMGELFADRKDTDQVVFTSGLVELAKQASATKTQIKELTDDIAAYNDATSGSSMNGKQYQAFTAFLDKYKDIDVAKTKLNELVDVYAALRRQIDAAIAAMEKENPPVNKWDAFKQKLTEIKDAVANSQFAHFGKQIAGAAAGVVQLTGSLGKMLWAMEPIHKWMGKLQSSLHSLWVRVKRVLVYSTIVSFFRTVKNQIAGFLKQNNELMSALGKAKGAWITAFMPVYNYVVPRITALIRWLTELGAKVAMLTARIFGGSVKASKAQAKALQDEAAAAGGAAKAYEAQLAAFDELNILEEDKGSGGGSDEDLAAPDFDFEEGKMKDYLTWYDWLYDKASKVVEIYKKLNEWLGKCADKMNELAVKTLQMFRGDNQQMADAMLQKFQEIGTTLADALNNFVGKVKWSKIGQALGAGIDLALQSLRAFIYQFNWSNLGQAIASKLNGMIWEIDWANIGAILVSAWNIVWQTLAGFMKKLDFVSIGRAIADALMSAIRNIDIKSFGTTIANLVKGLAKTIVAFVRSFNMFEFASTLFRKIMDAISEINWLELARDIIAGLAAGLWGGVQAIVGAIIGVCQGLIDAFKKFFGISSPSKVMEEQGNFLIQGLMNGIKTTWTTLLGWLQTAFTNLKNFFSNLWETIKTTASEKWASFKDNTILVSNSLADGVVTAFNGLKSGLSDTLNGVKQVFSDAWTAVVDGTKSKFSTLIKNISDSASSIGSTVSSMLSSIGSGISNAWSKIKDFVSSAVSKLGSVSIPKFASGGVITKPTVGLVGEYAGASHNPEIITPESMLRGIMAESNDDLVSTFIQVGRQVVQAIQENSVDIKIGDDVISAAAARGDRDYKKRTGRSQFAV